MPRMFPTIHRIAVASAATASLVLAGCSDSASSPNRAIAPDAASLSQTPDVIDATGRHVFHTKQWFQNDAQQNARPGGGGSTNTGIYYHGGPVLQSGTNVAAVYWSASTIYNGGPTPGSKGAGSSDGSLVGFFLSHLGGSPYFNINSSYTDGTGAAIQNSVTYTQFWANDTPPATPSNVTDAQMVAMLQYAFDNSKLTYNASTLYAIFTDKNVNLGGNFGNYCAYHYHGTVTINSKPVTVLYAAMPRDQDYPGSCTNASGSPNGDAAADAEVNTLAHEVEETTTDLLGTAWFDHRGYENADKCAWTWGPTSTATNGALYNVTLGGKNFLIQRNWVNSGSGGCAMSF